jgi:hypothetical protein
MKLSEVREKFIAPTTFADDLSSFVDRKINANFSDNVFILYKEGAVARKTGKIVQIPIMLSMLADSSPDFIDFVAMLMVWGEGNSVLVEIEFPNVEQKVINNRIIARISDVNGKNVKDFSLALVEPLSDIVYRDFEAAKTGIYAKLTAMATAKYVSALTSSYALYKNMQNNQLASFAAIAHGIAAIKLVRKSSMIDLRQWITLPDNIRVASVNLLPGKYVIELYSVISDREELKHTENIVVADGERVLVDINN